MKKHLVSLVLCLVLVSYLFTPYTNVAAADYASPGNVIVSGSYAVYSYEDAQCRYIIFLDTSTSSGSFAVVYNSTPNLMYEYIFALPTNGIDVASSSFWNHLIADCFENVNLDHAINLNTAVIPSTDSQIATTYAVTSDPYEDDFLDWLENKHGPAREGSYVYGTTVNGITFLQYENVEYQVVKSNSHVVTKAISIAGLITSIFGFYYSPGLVAALGLLFSGASLVPAGTRIDTYTLCVYWEKYITAKDGTIRHSFTWKSIDYQGFLSGNTCVVNEDEPFIAYESSKDYSINPTRGLIL